MPDNSQYWNTSSQFANFRENELKEFINYLINNMETNSEWSKLLLPHRSSILVNISPRGLEIGIWKPEWQIPYGISEQRSEQIVRVHVSGIESKEIRRNQLLIELQKNGIEFALSEFGYIVISKENLARAVARIEASAPQQFSQKPLQQPPSFPPPAFSSSQPQGNWTPQQFTQKPLQQTFFPNTGFTPQGNWTPQQFTQKPLQQTFFPNTGFTPQGNWTPQTFNPIQQEPCHPPITPSWPALTEVKKQESSMTMEYEATQKVMTYVFPYFTKPYRNGTDSDVAKRDLDGSTYTVERFNHGLAHGLRQGSLAKDILNSLAQVPMPDTNSDAYAFIKWAKERNEEGFSFLAKLEMASAFQRTGRQSEVSNTSNKYLYKIYENADRENFVKAAKDSGIFKNDEEIDLFQEAIRWQKPGKIEKNANPELKYIRSFLHGAHTLDLRRIPTFSEERIKKELTDQLNIGDLAPDSKRNLISQLWQRSGIYLEATGDRDLVTEKYELADIFFHQNNDPDKMVQAVHKVRRLPLVFSI